MMLVVKEGIEVEISCGEELCYEWIGTDELDGKIRSEKHACHFLEAIEEDIFSSTIEKKYGKCTFFNCDIINKLNKEYNYHMYNEPVRCEQCITIEKIKKMKEILQ